MLASHVFRFLCSAFCGQGAHAERSTYVLVTHGLCVVVVVCGVVGHLGAFCRASGGHLGTSWVALEAFMGRMVFPGRRDGTDRVLPDAFFVRA